MKIIRSLTPFLLLLVTAAAFAADPSGGSSTSAPTLLEAFTIPQTDQSLALLGMLFGGMGDVLPGAPNVMGAMFAKFNDAMIILASLVMTYTIIFGLVSTAHEGEFLGKKFNSVWTPIRTVLGIGLLVPMKSGYCLLQILMMWVVLQGIGAADSVWNAAVNYITTHGLYSQSNYQSPGSTTKGSYSYLLNQSNVFTQDVFKAYVCMYENYRNKAGSGAQRVTLQTPAPTINKSAGTMTYYFPTYQKDGTTVAKNDGCGYATVPYIAGDVSSNLDKSAQQAASNAMPDIMNVLNGAGQEYAYCDNTGANGAILKSSCVTDDPIAAANKFFANHVTQAESDYMSSHASTVGDSPNAVVAIQELNNELKQGWIYAGAFYKQLGLISPQMAAANVFSGTNFTAKIAPNPSYTQGYVDPGDDVKNLDQYSTSGGLGGSIAGVSDLGGGSLADIFDDMANIVISSFVQNLSAYQSQNISFANGADPVVGIQTMGTEIVNTVKDLWNKLFWVAMGIVGISAAISCLKGIAMMTLKVFGFFVIAFTLFFAVGLSMATYIPMIPYVIFFFGALGWLISVVETMLAAPMVALGIVYPDGGHELLGRAAPAAMLVTNVFIRPTLMIFGLIGGMLLSYVGVLLLNSAYQFVVVSNVTYGGGGTAGPFEWVMYMIIYVSIVIVMLNKCYALIHKLPDQVLRWIGGTAGFGEYSNGAEEVGQRATQAAGTMKETTSQATTGLTQGASSLADELG